MALWRANVIGGSRRLGWQIVDHGFSSSDSSEWRLPLVQTELKHAQMF